MFSDRDKFVDKKFKVLLDDAVYFLSEAERLRTDKSEGTSQAKLARRWISHARASLVNSILLLECAANVLIDTLDLGPVAFEAIDRRPVLEKFAFYLEVKHPTVKIDKSAPWFREAKELIDYRNTIVHSKPYRGKWKQIAEETYQAEIGDTPLLKLPHSLLAIEAPEALCALQAALSFLSHYFVDLCGYTHYRTHQILVTDWGSESVAIDRSWFDWVDRWGLHIAFILDVAEIRKLETEFGSRLSALFSSE